MRLLFFICSVFFFFFSSMAEAKIVFAAKHDKVIGIYVMEDDGSNIALITDTLSPTSPRWSPTGKKIVFRRRVTPENSQGKHIFIMNRDGTDIHQLTPPPTNGSDGHPSFFPDGTSIIFGRYENIDRESRHGVIRMDLARGTVKKIAEHGTSNPEVSPDGKNIVFTSLPAAGGSGGNVMIMNDAGRNLRPLIPPPQNAGLIISRWDPRWSPDGRQILYMEDRDELNVIDGVTHYIPQGTYYYIYDLHSGVSRRLDLPKDLRSTGIDWMDNGKAILLAADYIKLNTHEWVEPDYNFYKFNLKSSELTQLTDHLRVYAAIDWIDDHVLPVSPIGKQPIQWGKLKAFLNTRVKALKAFASSLSDYPIPLNWNRIW